MNGLSTTIGGALTIAALSTLGDLLWSTWIPHHRPVYGLAHGLILFLCIGGVLGGAVDRTATGALGAAAIGLAAAAGYYRLAPVAGYNALFVMWVGLWIAIGLLNGRVLRRQPGLGPALARGLLAAVMSGLAFYAVSGIWMPFDPQGWDYAVHFVSWIFVYGLAFAPLLLGMPDRRP